MSLLSRFVREAAAPHTMRHFTLQEFQCPCCEKSKMDSNFLAMIDQAREVADVPFSVNSGYRCEHRNRQIADASPNSSHMAGKAADIQAMTSAVRFAIVDAAIQVGFNRIGVADTFIHLDNDADKPQCMMWTY